MRRTSFLALTVLACGGDSGNAPQPRTAAALQVMGDLQVAQVATQLPQPIRVRVLDKDAIAIPNQLVTFHVVKGGGSVFSGAAMTNAAGEALERWTLGTIAGEQIMEARAIDQITGAPIVFATVKATAEPGPLAQAGFESESTWVLGDSLYTLPAVARDAYGNDRLLPTVTSLGALTAERSEDGSHYLVLARGHGRFRFAMASDTLLLSVFPPAIRIAVEYSAGDSAVIDRGQLVHVRTENGTAFYDLANAEVVRTSRSTGGTDTTRYARYSGYALAQSLYANMLLPLLAIRSSSVGADFVRVDGSAWVYVLNTAGRADTLRLFRQSP